MRILVATDSQVLVVDAERGTMAPASGLTDRPTCLAGDPLQPGRAWCGTRRSGVFRSDDGGESWRPASGPATATGPATRAGAPAATRAGTDAGSDPRAASSPRGDDSLAGSLAGRAIMAVAASPTEPGVVWAGTEPSQVWRSGDGGERWERLEAMESLPSSSEWSFPPRPETHHVRWIACHPREPGRIWVAVEAGALVSTADGGRTWRDRVPGGPFDTHELAIHPAAPETLRVSAGDGYYESDDGGATWRSPEAGLEVRYLRSVAIDPGDADVVVVSAASAPRRAYVAGHADGRLYRRVAARSGDGQDAERDDGGGWERVRHGWPDPPATIAPLLMPGTTPGELWAADERGIHRSGDGGVRWESVARFPARPEHLRGVARG